MAETSVNQMKLARDAAFLDRLEYNLVAQAVVVLGETGVGSTHAARATYAKQVISSAQEYTRKAATMIVGGINVIGTVTVTPASAGPPGAAEIVATTVTDGALFSQVSSLWNKLAGIDSGN